MNSISEPSHIHTCQRTPSPTSANLQPKDLASAETIQHTARSVNGERNQLWLTDHCSQLMRITPLLITLDGTASVQRGCQNTKAGDTLANNVRSYSCQKQWPIWRAIMLDHVNMDWPLQISCIRCPHHVLFLQKNVQCSLTLHLRQTDIGKCRQPGICTGCSMPDLSHMELCDWVNKSP